LSSTLIRRGLVAPAVVGAIALILVGAAHLPLVRARVFEWARGQAAQKFGVIVQAESLGYNLLAASVELRNPTLATQGERPFFAADSVRLRFSRSVLWGTIEIQGLELARPRVTIVRHANGTTNLPVSQTAPSSGTTPLHLGIVELRQISIEVEDEGADRAVRAGPIDLMLDSRSTDPRPGAFGPSPFAVRLAATADTQATRSVTGTLAGRLGFDGSRLTVPELNVETPEGRLTLSGWIDFVAEALSVETQGRLDLDLARAGRFIGASGTVLAGSARAQFAVSGSLADPVVRVDVVGRDVSYGSVAVADLSANATYTGGRLAIERLDVTSSFGAGACNRRSDPHKCAGHAKHEPNSGANHERPSRSVARRRGHRGSGAPRLECERRGQRDAGRRATFQTGLVPSPGSERFCPDHAGGIRTVHRRATGLPPGSRPLDHRARASIDHGTRGGVRRGVGTDAPWSLRRV
jgi:hypothetical protein